MTIILPAERYSRLSPRVLSRKGAAAGVTSSTRKVIFFISRGRALVPSVEGHSDFRRENIDLRSQSASSVDFAVEELVFFLARGSSAAEGATEEEDDANDGETDWNPGSHCVEPDEERV